MTSLCLSKRAFGDVSTFVTAGIPRHSSPLAALDLDGLTGQQMLDLVAELSTAVRPLRSLLYCGLGRPAIVTSGRPPHRRRRLWWEGGSAGSGDAQPGGTQNGERGLVEEVGHRDPLQAARDGVPRTGRAVVQ